MHNIKILLDTEYIFKNIFSLKIFKKNPIVILQCKLLQFLKFTVM